MYINKQRREIDKLIVGDGVGEVKDNPSIVDIKIDSKEQLYSAYSFSGDKLNSEFGDYVFEKAKNVPFKDDITIRIHSNDSIDADEVNRALKSHYRAEYREAKKSVGRMTLIACIMTVLGIIALTALILMNRFTDNFYINSIIEIAAWVFVWEAVDYFFLQRPVEKAKCVLIQRIYMSKIEICKDIETASSVKTENPQ